MGSRRNRLFFGIGAASALSAVVLYFPVFGFVGSAAARSQKDAYSTWSSYAGSPDSMSYSSLDQVNKSNVKQLKLAWFVPAPGPAGRFSFNPLVIDGVMYIVGKDDGVYALDAATGKQIWAHPVQGGQPTNRGFNHWISKDGKDRRLIFSVDGYLQELDMKTGEPILSFGDKGRVNLREGLGRDIASFTEVQSGTPGRIFENLLILGSAPGEAYGSPPGDIRAYDARTGKMAWIFHTVPHPGEFGYDTFPPDAWKRTGGNNAWGEISLDEKRGIAYFPLGSPTYDLYGADRTGTDLYGDTLLALDARTGKRRWYFQLVHHDLWDYDPTASPKLLTITHDGKKIDVVAQATKFGYLYVFDRVTGKPVWPIEERPVPKSDMPNEHSWPTQPVPAAPPPFARQKFTVDDINPYLDPEEKARIREIVLKASNDGIYTPPAYGRQTIEIPGENGGANQGSTSADPTTGVMYVKTYDAPTIHNMTEAAPVQHLSTTQGPLERRGYALYQKNCVACHGPNRERITYPATISFEKFTATLRAGNGVMPAFSESALKPEDVLSLSAYLKDPVAGEGNPENPHVNPSAPPPPTGQTRFYGQFGFVFRSKSGLTAFSPPWTSLVAYDLNAGTIKWRRPLGTTPGLAAKGITDTGSAAFPRNGPVATAGGLLVIATGPDRMIHALDKETGETLWETEIDANPDGIPAIYQVAGKEYLAFYAAAATTPESIVWKPAKPDAQGYYVFALPSAGK
ncbi:MAG: PQQ-binding-like beta-propeller repeat protein [Acidobacteriaceae bacterium]